jgi:hypothetical protein
VSLWRALARACAQLDNWDLHSRAHVWQSSFTDKGIFAPAGQLFRSILRF